MHVETDGAYDPDKVVDVMAYADSGNISGGNVSGAAYSAGAL